MTDTPAALAISTEDEPAAASGIDLDAMSAEDLAGYAKSLREEWERTQKACIKRAGVDPDIFFDKSMPQSELFMVEIIPIIHQLYFNWPYNGTVEVLDIGPQTFTGTRLLSRLHAPKSFNNLKMKITALDIHDRFLPLKECICPEVEFIKSDVFDVRDRSWDLIICSHVLEHVPQPEAFLQQLQKLSRRDVIVACPWNEDPITTKGHVNTIGKALVRKSGARDLRVFTNFMWGKTREVCIFTLDGKAPRR
jgi:SAM-dependent methyltransferase